MSLLRDIFSNNTTGVAGVSRSKGYNGDIRTDYIGVNCSFHPNGEKKRFYKRFSIQQLGEEVAMAKAVAYRVAYEKAVELYEAGDDNAITNFFEAYN